MPPDAWPVVHPAEVLHQDLQPHDVAGSPDHEVRVAEDSAVDEDQGPVADVGEDDAVLARRDAWVCGVQDQKIATEVYTPTMTEIAVYRT